MKMVLLIASFYPYRQGSMRVPYLLKYLPEFDWQPIILTPFLSKKPDSQFMVIETPYHDTLSLLRRALRLKPNEDVRKQVKGRLGTTSTKPLIDFMLTRVSEIVDYPDHGKGWQPFALKAGAELLQSKEIGAMISIWPVTSHLIANKLKGKFGIPWVADFPDLWSQNHNYQYSPLRRALDRRLELKTLSQADALTTVAEPWAEKLRSLHKGKSVYTITHGFDAAGVNDPPAPLTAKFTITYTGSIYAGKQDPTRLLAALRDLISSGIVNPNEIEVRFYGSGLGWLDREIVQYGLTSFVKRYEPIPQPTAIEKQKESQLLLLLDWDDPQEKGVYTGKIFEYFGARRPILATGGSKSDVVAELLEETKTGRHAPTVEDVKKALAELYGEYKLKGKVAYRGEPAQVDKYSHRQIAQKFSAVLDQLA